MTKITSSIVLRFFMLTVLAVGAPVAGAQEAPNPLNDKNPGTGCLPYDLDVVSLVSNNVQMFWKQTDCITVHVTNNPFLFKYDLTFNEQLIKEDDPLSGFGGKFGLNTSSVNPSGGTTPTPAATTDTAKKDLNETQAGKQGAVGELTTDAATQLDATTAFDAKTKARIRNSLSMMMVAGQKGEYALQEEKLNDVEKLMDNKPQTEPVVQDVKKLKDTVVPTPTPEQIAEWRKRVAARTSDAALIRTTLGEKTAKYNAFSRKVPQELEALSKHKTLDQVDLGCVVETGRGGSR